MDVAGKERTGAWTAAMAGLALLFALRVAGQLVQVVAPQPWLPPVSAWQGSGLPYPVLLGAQLAIVCAMAWTIANARSNALHASAGRARAWTWAGSLYLVAALARIGIGLGIASAPAWFRAWLPAAFHLVLAGFVLALGRWHASFACRQGGAA